MTAVQQVADALVLLFVATKLAIAIFTTICPVIGSTHLQVIGGSQAGVLYEGPHDGLAFVLKNMGGESGD